MGEHWTEEHIEFLKERWKAGDSASVIAKEIGVSRNAVLGKAHRLDLPTHHTITTANGFRAERKERPQRMARAKPRPEKVAEVEAIINRPPPPVIEHVVKPVSMEMSLLDLKDGDCRWPTGERSDITFCGHNTERDKPYCTYHCRLAYNPRGVEPRTFLDNVRRAA